MANNAQNSQNKSDNLGRGRVAYAFKVSRVNPDFLSLKIWILGYYSKVCSIAVASLPKIVAQIDTALADGECEFEIGGIRFSADEKLLKSIRKELSSYCCNVGASDANHVPSAGKAAQPQPESLRSTKPKASAPACKPSARQLSNEERRTKNEELARSENESAIHSSFPPAGVADCCGVSRGESEKATVKECCSCGDDNNAAIHSSFSILNSSFNADGLIQAFREVLRAELAPIRAVLEELSFKAEELTVFAKGNSVLPLPESSFPRTRRGRTSVVVGVRKISTLKNKNKEKKWKIEKCFGSKPLCAPCAGLLHSRSAGAARQQSRRQPTPPTALLRRSR